LGWTWAFLLAALLVIAAVTVIVRLRSDTRKARPVASSAWANGKDGYLPARIPHGNGSNGSPADTEGPMPGDESEPASEPNEEGSPWIRPPAQEPARTLSGPVATHSGPPDRIPR
jgi:hypothetical protein